MRMIIIDERTDLQGLRTRLVGDKAISENALDGLKNLNPHVNFKKIPAGTVLLIPDLPGMRRGVTSSVHGDVFDSLREQLLASLKATGVRVREGYDALLAEQKEVSAVVKAAPFKRALEADPELKEQLEAGMAVFKQDQEEAKAVAEELKALQSEAGAELAALAKLLA